MKMMQIINYSYEEWKQKGHTHFSAVTLHWINIKQVVRSKEFRKKPLVINYTQIMSGNLTATLPSATKDHAQRALKKTKVMISPCKESVAEDGCASPRLCKADYLTAFSVPRQPWLGHSWICRCFSYCVWGKLRTQVCCFALSFVNLESSSVFHLLNRNLYASCRASFVKKLPTSIQF